MTDACPTCKRPFKKLTNEQRARTAHQGTEHEAVKHLGDMTATCSKVYDLLREASTDSFRNSWVSAEELRNLLNGGDGPRRARQLREEFGVPVESKMRVRPDGKKMAYYNIAASYFEPKKLIDVLAPEPQTELFSELRFDTNWG